MPLFIERLPFHSWIDATKNPPIPHRSILMPMLMSESSLPVPPSISIVQDWVLDTGSRGEAFAWRGHLLTAGMDPDIRRLPHPIMIRTVAGIVTVPVRDVDLWLLSNLQPSLPPFRIQLVRGLPFRDVRRLPDPQLERPLIGIEAMRTAGLRVEIDFTNDTVSVWTPDQSRP